MRRSFVAGGPALVLAAEAVRGGGAAAAAVAVSAEATAATTDRVSHVHKHTQTHGRGEQLVVALHHNDGPAEHYASSLHKVQLYVRGSGTGVPVTMMVPLDITGPEKRFPWSRDRALH